jgi:hypothetical protein
MAPDDSAGQPLGQIINPFGHGTAARYSASGYDKEAPQAAERAGRPAITDIPGPRHLGTFRLNVGSENVRCPRAGTPVPQT